jgi:hypothetical protein
MAVVIFGSVALGGCLVVGEHFCMSCWCSGSRGAQYHDARYRGPEYHDAR